MSITHWLRVPIGPHGRRWSTVPVQRYVLVVVHTVTAMNRLADLLSIFDSDHRIQLVFTFPEASAVAGDVERRLRDRGAILMPWPQVANTEFDLAISVHHSGNLHDINAPLVLLSHGIGYTKYGNTEIRKYGAVYGLSPEWLLRDGVVVPSAVVLSHDEQRRLLAELTPEALPTAVLAGDPCYDRMLVSLPLRRRYREALGADDHTIVVAVSSTWGRASLFGQHPELMRDLVAELPSDDHLVVAVLHPNTWFGHGPLQIRCWLGECLRSGLRLVPPAQGWQQAIIAADVVIGDHGAVSGYAAAIGRPTMLTAFPDGSVVPGSAIAAMGDAAPRLDPRRSLHTQVHETLDLFDPDSFAAVAELASSVPGQSARILRRTCYGLMDLPEPEHAALIPQLPVEDLSPEHRAVTALRVAGELTSQRSVRLTRWPADVVAARGRLPTMHDTHLVVAAGHPRPDLLGNAAIVVHELATANVDRELTQTLHRLPGCMLAVSVTNDATSRIRCRDGSVVDVRVDPAPRTWADATVGASALYLWLVHGRPVAELPESLTVTMGGRRACLELAHAGG